MKKSKPRLERRKTDRKLTNKSDEFIVFEELKAILHTLHVVRQEWKTTVRFNLKQAEEHKLIEPVLRIYGMLGEDAEVYSQALERLSKKKLKKVS